MVGNVLPTVRQEVEPELFTPTCTHIPPSQFFNFFLSKGVDSNIVIALWLALSWPIVSQLVPTGARRVFIQMAEVALSTT